MIQSEQTKIADFLYALGRQTASVCTQVASTYPDDVFGDGSSTISAPSSTISDDSSTIPRSREKQAYTKA